MNNECSWYDPSCALGWIRDEFKALALWFYDAILSGVASLVELIPVPDFLQNIQPVTLPPAMAWFAQMFQIEYGLGILVAAYTLRFIIRRLPIVG